MKYTISEIKKTNLKDTFFGKFFYRKLATYFTYFLVKKNLTRNQVSFLSLIFALIGAAFLATGTYSSMVLGVILVQIGMILDYSDGQIARLRKKGTQRGAWLDVLFGMIQNNILILAIILALTNNGFNDRASWFLGFIVLFAWNMTCFVHLNAMIFFPKLELKKTEIANKVRSGLKLQPQFFSIGSDVYFVFIGLGVIFSLLWESLVLLAVLGNLYWVTVFLFIFYTRK